MSKGKAYLVPVAHYGFIRVDARNPFAWGLDDEDGRMIEVNGMTYWREQEDARANGTAAGYEVQP